MGRRNPTPERQFQKTLVQALELFGYEVNHTYPLMTKHGWRTGTTAIGWPDLMAVRPPRMLAIEVKGEHTPIEPAQIAWLSLFAEVPCARAWIVRPQDPEWPVIQGWIRRPQPAPRTYGFEPMQVAEARAMLAEIHRQRAQRRVAKRRSGRGSPGATPDTPLPL